MARRVTSSEQRQAETAPKKAKARVVESDSAQQVSKTETAGKRQHDTPKRAGRTASSRDVRVSSSTKRSREGSFVDPRALSDEDIVQRTLQETTGTLGIADRPKVVDFNARLQERRKANTRVVLIRVLQIAGVCAVLAALAWFLFFSSFFRLETANISVTGANEWVSETQIMNIAEKQSGKSLFLVSGDDVIAQLQDIPGVTQAKADKRFPNKLRVSVTAQKPAAMLKTGDDSLTAVDGKGRVLNSVNGASADGIPVIEVSSVDKGLNDKAVKETLKILSALPDAMRARISKVSAQTQDSITTQLDSGNYTVIWGDASDLELKMAVVDKIINDPSKIGDKHQVDVSAPLRPIIK